MWHFHLVLRRKFLWLEFIGHKPVRFPLAAAALLLFSGWVTAQAGSTVQTLSLATALLEAEARSAGLASQDAIAAAAREMAVSAGQLPDPVLRLSMDNLVVDGPNSWSLTQEPMTMESVGLMQTFTREEKRSARALRYEQEARLVEARRLVQLAALRRDTALAWLERHYRERMVALLQQQRDENVLLVEASEAGFRSGRNLQTDVFISRAEMARVDDRILEAEALLANAITALARWIGTSASAPLGEAPAIATSRLQAAALEQQLARQPELLVSSRQEAVAQADAELAQLNKREDWSVEFMLSRRGPDFGNMVSLGVSIPLQLGHAKKQDRELAAKLALVESARSERIELLREYRARIQGWLDIWRSNLDRLSRYDETLIPLAEERTQAALSAYQGNNAPLTVVLDARRAEIETGLERLRIEMETAALWARLEFLIPPDAPNP